MTAEQKTLHWINTPLTPEQVDEMKVLLVRWRFADPDKVKGEMFFDEETNWWYWLKRCAEAGMNLHPDRLDTQVVNDAHTCALRWAREDGLIK